MKKIFYRIFIYLGSLGIDPIVFYCFIKGVFWYLKDYITLKGQKSRNRDFSCSLSYPVLTDRYQESGSASGHYFHQDFLVARRIFTNWPEKHVDIGSRVDGFVAHVAVFRKIKVFDIRPQKSNIKNIIFRQANLMHLPQNYLNYCDSLSSLHAIEHFGLGRYGDPVEYNGHIRALDNIYKILKKKGKFYLSVPIGIQRIEFNAHRIFSIKYLLGLFDKRYRINMFSYVDDNGSFHENVKIDNDLEVLLLKLHFGCGIFEMTKN